MVDFSQVKKYLIFNLIGCLVLAALVAVVVVIVGKFNDVTQKALVTLLVAMLHSLVSLLFVWDDSRRNAFNRLPIFVNTIFILVITSFFTLLFGIWKILPYGTLTVGHLYQTYLMVAFAALHVDLLYKVVRIQKLIDGVVFANYLFIAVVLMMVQPIVYTKNAYMVLHPMYFRLLSAAIIIDGTLTLLAIIFYRLYLHSHPEIKNSMELSGQTGFARPRGLSAVIWVIIIFLMIFWGLPMLYGFMLLGFGAY